ncbi:hypothetical protein ACWC2T_09295 [Streptomyces sp. NPDC001393]
MNVDEQLNEARLAFASAMDEIAGTARARAVAVAAVLAPTLTGTFAVVLVLGGYLLDTVFPGAPIAQTVITSGWMSGAVAAVTFMVGTGVLLFVARRHRASAEGDPEASARSARPLGDAARRTLGLAYFIVGERRAHLREEWAAVLTGDPDNGIVLSPRRRMRYAVGFLWAALRMRLRDLAAPVWMPVDWLLSAESRTRGVIALTVGAQVVYVECQDGFHALVTEGWGWCAGCGVALRLFVGWLRKIRGIELASPRSDSHSRSTG